jgi:hypothetical protein
MSQSADSDSKEDQRITSAEPSKLLQNPQLPRNKNQAPSTPETNSGEKE